MKVLVTGSTGMVGALVLKSCLDSDDVTEVIALNRRPTELKHVKYREIVVQDFVSLSNFPEQLTNIDVVYYCLGAYTGQLPRDQFYQVNVDYPKALSQYLIQNNEKSIRFCLLSGAGADRSGKARFAFAKDKGEIENYLAKQHPEFYAFRPGYIYPVTPREEPNFTYRLSRWLYPIIKRLGTNASVTSEHLAQAIVQVGIRGNKQKVFENADIRLLG